MLLLHVYFYFCINIKTILTDCVPTALSCCNRYLPQVTLSPKTSLLLSSPKNRRYKKIGIGLNRELLTSGNTDNLSTRLHGWMDTTKGGDTDNCFVRIQGKDALKDTTYLRRLMVNLKSLLLESLRRSQFLWCLRLGPEEI